MGRGQVVRQRVLVPLFGGSNPSAPEGFYAIAIVFLVIAIDNGVVRSKLVLI